MAGGGLVTRCDADEVGNALETLLRDSRQRQSMGKAGRQFVQQHYIWPAIIGALTSEYERVIRRVRCGAGNEM